jgi:thiol-disulfide isomerase/thioredoxin
MREAAIRRILGAGAGLLGAIAAALVLYHFGTDFMIGRSNRHPVSAAANAASSDAFNFSFFDQPRALIELHFIDGEYHALSLADFRGRPVLLNIWATWCVPCRKEMPALDRLQTMIGESELVVLPLSIDRQGLPVVKQFYQELGLKSLGIYVDQLGKASSALNAVGVPTTLLVDRDGREIGRKIGPAEWDSPETIALIREHLRLPVGAAKSRP